MLHADHTLIYDTGSTIFWSTLGSSIACTAVAAMTNNVTTSQVVNGCISCGRPNQLTKICVMCDKSCEANSSCAVRA